ncbi:MAG: tetratricopeptide repeat protein [Tepidisphaeraceae bacterium]
MTIDQTIAAAVQHHQAGRLREAEQLYRQVLAVDAKHYHALHLLGVLANQSGHHGPAIDLITRAISIHDSDAAMHANLGWAYRSAGRSDAALASADRALSRSSAFPNALTLRAVALHDLGDFAAAVEAWRRVVARRPDDAQGWSNLAVSYEQAGQLEEGLAASDRAIALDPNYAPAHVNRGSLLAKLGRLSQGVEAHRRAIALQPALVNAYVNLASVAQELGLVEEAAAAARKAVALEPDEVGAHQNLANALQDQGHLDDAARSFATAVELLERRASASPPPRAAADRELANRLRLMSATMLPAIYESVEEIDQRRELLIDGIAGLRASGATLRLEEGIVPTLFALAYQGRDDRRINADFASLMSAPPAPPPASTPTADDGRRRIGFISRFFRNHTIGRLNQGLIDQLDREKFEVTVLSVGDANDDVAQFIRARADRFVALPPNLAAARQLVADARLDLLLYTDLGMDPVTYSLAHTRLAPVQCVTWGHPVTTGIPMIDHFISAAALETEGSESQYTERLARLDSLAVYYFRPKLNAPKTRADFGLDDGAMLYGCLQMLWKFHPDFDEMIGGVLRRDPNGIVLIIAGLTKFWDERLMTRFRRTIPDVAGRIRFIARLSNDNFLALTALCDVMLDPPHFGGGNTTYEALAFGVPVVTLPSQFLRGRITKAIYDAMGMTDCVATTPAHYIEIAASFGLDRDHRAAMRDKILATNQVLFENAAAVRELEVFCESVVTKCR